MIKQLIVAVALLLIHNTSKVIQFKQAIFDFRIWAKYFLYNNKML